MNMPIAEKKAAAGISGKTALRGGSYSLAITAVVLAILIAVNVLADVLPSSLTKFDISSTRLYSITSNTKVVVNALEKDVTIYWIVQSGQEDDVVENLLDKYDSLSDHIQVVKKNPDTYPTFAAQYTDDTVYNNSLIVECGSKYRYISYSDIYLTDIDYTTYSYVYSFDGEGAITSAIDYVVSDDLPVVYMLQGHGEAELSSELSGQIERENIEMRTFSLLNEDAIPEDAACILIYCPTGDISTEEETILAEYIAGGGKLMVMAGPVKDASLDNLNALLGDYGITCAEGIVIEEDRSHYAFQSPYVCLPDLGSSEITSPLAEDNYYVIVPIASGLTLSTTDKGAVTELLTTSSEAFSKVSGYNLTTYEREDDDLSGPFTLAVSIEDYGGGGLVWVASSNMLDSMYNAYSSGANLSFFMNCLSSLIGQSEAMSIRTKSMGYNYLTISGAEASVLEMGMIGIVPLAFLITGILVILRRRERRR